MAEGDVKVTRCSAQEPAPNYLVGGAPCSFNLEESNAINAERLAFVGKLFKEGQEFVEQVYLPDLLAVASFYKDWGAVGGGLSNYMAYGISRCTATAIRRSSSSRAA